MQRFRRGGHRAGRTQGHVTREVAEYALRQLEVDEHGLDEMDKRILLAIMQKYGGGPVGSIPSPSPSAKKAGTIEEVYEPYLIQEDSSNGPPAGRETTQLSYDHFHIERSAAGDQTLFP